ncbi:hypothetical protein JCM6882_003431 [Rhodosporidiobolus microsporus]
MTSRSTSNRGDYAPPSAPSSSSSSTKRRSSAAAAAAANPAYSDADSQLSDDPEGGYYAAGTPGGGDTGGAAPFVKASKKDKADKSRGEYAPLADPSPSSGSRSSKKKKHHSKRSSAAAAAAPVDGTAPYSDEEAQVGGGYDYGTPTQQGEAGGGGGGDGGEGKSRKKWWIVGGVVALILVIIIGVAVYLMNKDSSSSASDEAHSTAASALDDASATSSNSSTADASSSGSKSALTSASLASTFGDDLLNASASGTGTATAAPTATATTGSGLESLSDSLKESATSGSETGDALLSVSTSTSTGVSLQTLDALSTSAGAGASTGEESLSRSLGGGNDGETATTTDTATATDAVGGERETPLSALTGSQTGMDGDSLQSPTPTGASAATGSSGLAPLDPNSATTSAPALPTGSNASGSGSSSGLFPGGDAATMQTEDGMVTDSEGNLVFTSFTSLSNIEGGAPTTPVVTGTSTLSGNGGLQTGTSPASSFGGSMSSGVSETDSSDQESGGDASTIATVPNPTSTPTSTSTTNATDSNDLDVGYLDGVAMSTLSMSILPFSDGPTATAIGTESGSEGRPPTATSTSTSTGAGTGSMGKVFNTTAIFYSEIDWTGACGEKIEATSLTIGLPLSLYPNVSEPSFLCGEEVMVRNPFSGQKITVTVADASNRSSYALLPASAFQQLGGALADGELEVQFRFVNGSLEVEETEVEPDKGEYGDEGSDEGQGDEAAEMGEVHEGKAVYYSEVDWTGACGEEIKADSLTFGLPLSLYGDASAASPLCGAEVIVRNPDSGQKVTLHIAAPSENENAELPSAVYESLGGSLEEGEVAIQWRFVDGSVEKGEGGEGEGEESEWGNKEGGEGESEGTEGKEGDEGSEGDEGTEWAAEPKQLSHTSNSSNDSSSSSASSSSGNGKVYSGGSATYYYQKNNKGNCGTVSSDSALVVALPTSTYADGKWCGKTVKITRTADAASGSGSSGKKGQEVEAKVMDSCPSCENPNSLDLSVGAFKALGGTEKEGEFAIKWEFVDA